jgi:L-asparaginase
MNSANLAIASLGGTITMMPSDDDGVVPKLDAQSLVAAIPQLAAIADVHATTLATLPSASLGFDDILSAVQWARGQVENGVSGIVFAQGTDTLEESAYLFDLLWDSPIPVIFTGAMRSPGSLGSDGAANLLAATRVALSDGARDRGALVVFNELVHAASRVRKMHSSALDAFRSPNFGPLGTVAEGAVVFGATHRRHAALPLPSTGGRVALLECAMDDSGELIRLAASSGHRGIVLGALGVGHVSTAAAEAVSDVVNTTTVVFSSRTGSGTTFSHTYGFVGSESDLIRRGAIPAGLLDSRHARVLLWLLLASGCSPERIRDEFALRGN